MKRSRGILAAGVFLGTLFGCGALLAREQADYLRRIKPVLTARCLACHGVLEQKAGLRLDTAAFILKGARSGPVVRRGNPAASPLVRRVLAPEHGGRMPPEGEPLKPEEINAIAKFVGSGLPRAGGGGASQGG